MNEQSDTSRVLWLIGIVVFICTAIHLVKEANV